MDILKKTGLFFLIVSGVVYAEEQPFTIDNIDIINIENRIIVNAVFSEQFYKETDKSQKIEKQLADYLCFNEKFQNKIKQYKNYSLEIETSIEGYGDFMVSFLDCDSLRD